MKSQDSIKHRARIKREKGDGDEGNVVEEEERLRRVWRWEEGEAEKAWRGERRET